MRLQIINSLYVFVFMLAVPVSAQTIDYPSVFGKEWKTAEKYVISQQEAWDTIFPAFAVSPRLAAAVVFPELIRYSGLQNFMETTVVKIRYQQKGSQGANFSIGRFQMKPSFAEELESQWMQTPMCHEYKIYFDLSDNVEARRARVRRLDDPRGQCVYLALFLKLLYQRFPQLTDETEDRQVLLCATAYNASFCDSYATLEKRSRQSLFHTDFMANSKTVYYVYGEIAAGFYKSRQQGDQRPATKEKL